MNRFWQCGISLLVLVVAPIADSAPLSLREQVVLFSNYYREQEWTQAVQVWQQLSAVYVDEEVWPVIAARLQPQVAISMIFSDQSSAAIPLIEEWRKWSEEVPHSVPVMDWLYAIALELNGDNQRAAQAYASLAQTYLDQPEGELALYRQSDLAEDLDGLLKLLDSTLTLRSLQQSACLSAVHQALSTLQCELAASLYLQMNWADDALSGPVNYAGFGYQIVECLIACGHWTQASWIMDQLPDADRLQRQFEDWQARIVHQLQLQQAEQGAAGFVRAEYFRRKLAELAALQPVLQQWADNEAALRFLTGQTLFHSQRIYEAESVWRALRQQVTGQWAEEALLGLMTAAVHKEDDAGLRSLYAIYRQEYPASSAQSVRFVLLMAWRDFAAQRYYAVREWPELVEMNDRSGEAYYELLLLAAHAALMQQDLTVAEDILTVVRQEAGRDQQIKAEIALALCESGAGDGVRALQRLESISRNEKVAEFLREEAGYRLVYLASLHAEDARCIRYAQEYYSTFDDDQQRAEVHLLLAHALQRSGREQEALQACRRVGTERPELWGRSLLLQGEWLAALDMGQAWQHWQDAFSTPSIVQVPQVFRLLQQWLQLDGERFVEEWFAQMWLLVGDARSSDVALPWLRQVSLIAGDNTGAAQWLQQISRDSTDGERAEGRLSIALIDRLERDGRIEGARLAVMVAAEKLEPELQHAEVLAFVAVRLRELEDGSTEQWFDVLDQRIDHPQLQAWADWHYADQSIQAGQTEAALDRAKRGLAVSRDRELTRRLKIIKAKSLHASGEVAEAAALAQRILANRHYRGEGHAEVLLLLAQWDLAAGRNERARGYLERIRMMYQAYPQYVERAQQILEDRSWAG